MSDDLTRPLLHEDHQAIHTSTHQAITSNASPGRDSYIRLPPSRPLLQRYLSSNLGHYSVLLLVSLDVSCIFADLLLNLITCGQRHSHARWDVARASLATAGLVFSCLFVAELLVAVWAFGLQHLASRFHCFDAAVIVVSFVVDVVLHGTLEEVASLVVVLRLWRVFKIIEELSAGAADQTDGLLERIERLEDEKRELRRELLAVRSAAGSSELRR